MKQLFRKKSFRLGVSGLVMLIGCAVLSGCPDGVVICTSPNPVTSVALELIADGFIAPVGMAVPGDGPGRLFVLDQVGQIYIIDASGQRLPTPFLDLSPGMVDVGIDFGGGVVFDERGLIGLAFHPNYENNGRFYVFYTVPVRLGAPPGFDSTNCVSEFQVASNDPNIADASSERILLEIHKPQFNHNGGQLAFGSDGNLYVGVGDGGGAADDGSNNDSFGHNPDIGNGQDKSTWLGKILRINVDSGVPYAIPSDNPFVDDPDALPEIYALGLRNPWRFSFDRLGRLFVADVGQNLFEEVNIVARGGNYGWRVREGLHCFDLTDPDNVPPDNCATTDADGDPLIDPILEYPHAAAEQPFGISVIGGFVYEGTAIPCLRGEYVFGDWSTNFASADGSLYAAKEAQDGSWTMRELAISGDADGRIARFITSFGKDEDGELYICTSQNLGPTGQTGELYKIVSAE